MDMERKKEEGKEKEGGEGKGKGKWKGKRKGKGKGKENAKGKGKEKGKGNGKGKKKEKGKGNGRGRWKEDSLRKVGLTQVILYSVQCYCIALDRQLNQTWTAKMVAKMDRCLFFLSLSLSLRVRCGLLWSVFLCGSLWLVVSVVVIH